MPSQKWDGIVGSKATHPFYLRHRFQCHNRLSDQRLFLGDPSPEVRTIPIIWTISAVPARLWSMCPVEVAAGPDDAVYSALSRDTSLMSSLQRTSGTFNLNSIEENENNPVPHACSAAPLLALLGNWVVELSSPK